MVRGISLFSGGLDSMLAVCMLREQGIEMEAAVFQSPFFNINQAIQSAAHIHVKLHILDFTHDILSLVRCPPHGFGGAMNPCIDCHATMIRRAGEFMREHGYDFVATGEVLNQRPMSQNKRSLGIVAESSGLQGYLLRPLSAQLLDPTQPELDGRIDRTRLGAISGRNRQPQMELVKRYGITQFPSPAGGCLLTEKGYCNKLHDLFDHTPGIPPIEDIELMKYARQFRLPDGGRIIVGRNRADNLALRAHAANGKRTLLHTVNIPGPTALCLNKLTPEDLFRTAGILANYGDHSAQPNVTVKVIHSKSDTITANEVPDEILTVSPLARDTFLPWML